MGIRGQYANKRDGNEAGIFDLFRSAGLSVCPLDTPLDAIVGYAGRTYLVEIKNGHKAPLTKPQVAFLNAWTGQANVIRDDAQALAFIAAVKGGAL